MPMLSHFRNATSRDMTSEYFYVLFSMFNSCAPTVKHIFPTSKVCRSYFTFWMWYWCQPLNCRCWKYVDRSSSHDSPVRTWYFPVKINFRRSNLDHYPSGTIYYLGRAMLIQHLKLLPFNTSAIIIANGFSLKYCMSSSTILSVPKA